MFDEASAPISVPAAASVIRTIPGVIPAKPTNYSQFVSPTNLI